MARLGEVEFSVVEEETPEYTTESPERSIERGVDIVDHVRARPVLLNITGIVVGEDAAQKLQTLRRYARQGEVLRYVGRNIFSRMIIQALPTSHTYRTRNGFGFRLELKEVAVAKVRVEEYVAPDPAPVTPSPAGGAATSSEVKEVNEAGTQPTQEKEVDGGRRRSILKMGIDGLRGMFEKTDLDYQPASPALE